MNFAPSINVVEYEHPEDIAFRDFCRHYATQGLGDRDGESFEEEFSDLMTAALTALYVGLPNDSRLRHEMAEYIVSATHGLINRDEANETSNSICALNKRIADQNSVYFH